MTTQTRAQRYFITGAAGYIGSVVTELAISEGIEVHGLSRSENSDTKLRSLGAVPVRGDLTSLGVLRNESAWADVVIHLATAFTLGTGKYENAMPTDIAALDAITDGLAGTGKPLLTTSGTLMAAADPLGAETTEESPLSSSPMTSRSKTDAHALSLASKDIRVMVIRLAPYVYGRAGSGVKLFMGMSAQVGGVTCVDGGKNHTTVVHVDDAAKMYMLAAQKGKTGDIFNCSGATDVTGRELFGAIAETLGVPLRDITFEEAKAQVGETLAWFLKAENRASGAKAKRELGWEPSGMGILDEIKKGSYQGLAQTLRKPA